ncbi:MAG: CopG family transcriptional regulator [Chloroflexi bacterium]|nr:CopG family transcriptional regulator [Chloroflexota bacterium]
MHRTNIFLDSEQVRALKHLAAEERRSVAELVRRAVDEYLARRFRDGTDWGERFDQLVARIQQRIPVEVTPEEIEADITAAREEVRQAHRAAGAAADARGR